MRCIDIRSAKATKTVSSPAMLLAARPCFLMPGPYAPRDEVAAGLNLIRNLAAAIEP